MNQKTLREFIHTIPPGHWLPIIVTCCVTFVGALKFATDAVVAVSRHGGSTSAETDGDGASGVDASVQMVAATESAQQAAALPPPAEPMVSETLLLRVMDKMEESDNRWRQVLAERDVQVDGLRTAVTGLQGELQQQQAVVTGLRQELLQNDWDRVGVYRRRSSFSVPSRINVFRIDELNGVEGAPESRGNSTRRKPPKVVGRLQVEPFRPERSARATRVATPRSKRRSTYLNVSPRRRGTGSGPAPGSASLRQQKSQSRYEAALEWTRKYRTQSASSRLLGEMEAGHR